MSSHVFVVPDIMCASVGCSLSQKYQETKTLKQLPADNSFTEYSNGILFTRVSVTEYITLRDSDGEQIVIKDAVTLLAKTASDNFKDIEFDGILGLGLHYRDNKYKNWFQTAVDQKVFDRDMVTFFIRKNDNPTKVRAQK